MDLWIRVDADMGDAPDVAQLATTLYPEQAPADAQTSAVGHLVLLWGRVARHRVDGGIGSVPDRLLARWANWSGEPHVFAAAFRALYCDESGIIREWYDRQGKLVERARADRERKAAERAKAVPRTVRGPSADFPPLQDRDVTARNNSTLPAAGASEFDVTTHVTESISNHPALADLPRDVLDSFAAHVLRRAPAITLAGLLAEVAAARDGLHGVTRTIQELASALRDYVTNDTAPNAKLLRAYLRRAAEPQLIETPPTTWSGRSKSQSLLRARGAAAAAKKLTFEEGDGLPW